MKNTITILSLLAVSCLYTSCDYCTDDLWIGPEFRYIPINKNNEKLYDAVNPLYPLDSLIAVDNEGNFNYANYRSVDGSIGFQLHSSLTELIVQYKEGLKDTFQFGYYIDSDECQGDYISQYNVFKSKKLICEKCSSTLSIEVE